MKLNYLHLQSKWIRNFCFAIFSTALFSSCMVNMIFSNDITSRNRQNLGKLAIGMTKEQVLNIMGTQTLTTVDHNVRVTSPYRVETIKDNDGKTMEVLFFYTDEKKDETKVSDDELTPVILNAGKVEGWGRIYLADVAPAYRLRYGH